MKPATPVTTRRLRLWIKGPEMKLKCAQGPESLPVTLTETKTHLAVTDTGRDSLITGYLSAAVELVESFTRRKLITQAWDMILDCSIGDIALPFGRLQSVTSITYVDSAGSSRTVPALDYYVEGIGTDAGKIRFLDTFSFPALYDFEPVTVRFVCGFGDTGAAVPDVLKHAVLLHIENMWLGGDDNAEAIKALLYPFRVWGGHGS